MGRHGLEQEPGRELDQQIVKTLRGNHPGICFHRAIECDDGLVYLNPSSSRSEANFLKMAERLDPNHEYKIISWEPN